MPFLTGLSTTAGTNIMINTTTPTTVIYHSADYDGIFCREIARKFLPHANLIGWNFGDAKIPLPPEGQVYILDLSPDCLADSLDLSRVTWIDHHKTSIEKWDAGIPGYRIDGVAACRLAWQWFSVGYYLINHEVTRNLPHHEEFTERVVSEPYAVQLAGEYDIWDKRNPDAELLQYGLRVTEPTEAEWNTLLSYNGVPLLERMLEQGRIAQSYQQKVDADLVLHRSYRMQWEGLNFIVLNTGRFNSLTFAALDVPDTGHDALLGYMFNGKVWTVSLYHAKHRMDLDLSEIAKKHGGGGHRGACGFTCSKLPF